METLFLALRVLVALGAVLGLIWFVQRKMTRGGKKSAIAARFGGAAKRPIQVLGSHRLTAKASITVVEIDGVKLVLGVTEQGISVLEPAPAAPVVLAATPVAATIAEPAAIGSEGDLTRVAAPAAGALATGRGGPAPRPAPAPSPPPAGWGPHRPHPRAPAPAEEALASAGVEPAPVDFAAVFREALDEASTGTPLSTVVASATIRDQEHVATPRRRRMNVPALREQLLPHMTRTLAGAIGIRVAPEAEVPTGPASASAPRAQSHPTSATSALAAFLSNTPARENTKDYSNAVPLAERLEVLPRAS